MVHEIKNISACLLVHSLGILMLGKSRTSSHLQQRPGQFVYVILIFINDFICFSSVLIFKLMSSSLVHYLIRDHLLNQSVYCT